MTNLTPLKIFNAHEALRKLCDLAEETTTERYGAVGETEREYLRILEVLPPKPTLTMDNFFWTNTNHYLAEAKDNNGETVIMVGPCSTDSIYCIAPQRVQTKLFPIPSACLTPTGKRYSLKEISSDY